MMMGNNNRIKKEVMIFIIVIFFFRSSSFGNSVQQSREKASQLIEVIRASDMYVFPDRYFIALSNLVDAEDYNRHILSYRGAFSNTAGGKNHPPGAAHQSHKKRG